MERRGGIKKEREGAITAAQSQAGPGIAGCCSDGRPQERKTGKLRACGVGARGKWTSDGNSGLDLILIHYLDCWTKGIHIVIPVCIVSMLFTASKRNNYASILKASLGSGSMPFFITDNTTIPRTQSFYGRKRLSYEGGEE